MMRNQGTKSKWHYEILLEQNYQIPFNFFYFRFSKPIYSVDISENEPRGTFVEHVEARSTSTIIFEITNGNINDAFNINPSTGIIITSYFLDYEKIHAYNLTITATNMVFKTY